MGKNKIIIVVIALIIYVVSAGISYSVFSGNNPLSTTPSPPTIEESVKDNDYEAIAFDQSLPKTEVCPLSGVKYSKQQKAWWDKHRPLGVMIENHTEARPQSGLSFADVIYEAVAEGGITRLLVVFHCQDAGIIGPVRSARTYFVNFVSEYSEYPLYAHVGGANTPGPANAIGQIADYGWKFYNDLDQFGIPYPIYKQVASRNGREVATEHTMYSNTSRLWDYAEKKRDIAYKDKDGNAWDEDFVSYAYKEDMPVVDRPAAQSVHVEYWGGFDDFFVDWVYDKASNTYLRKNGGQNHLDRNTNKQLQAKNVVALLMQESRANDGYENNLHLIYKDKGTGKAIIFMDGKETKGTWRKDKRTSRTQLFASNGAKIELNPGLTWFHILPLEGVVDVK